MTGLERELRRISAELVHLDHQYALVGGLAVSARAEPRLTRDADLAVAVRDDADAERLIRALQARGYAVLAIVEQEATGRLATVRLDPGSASGAVTDLLFASCGVEPEIVEGAERIRVLPDLELPVATVGHLIAMKLLARDDRSRPLDADDLRALAEVASERDWAIATEAVGLIRSRGYDRDVDLVGGLAALRGGAG